MSTRQAAIDTMINSGHSLSEVLAWVLIFDVAIFLIARFGREATERYLTAADAINRKYAAMDDGTFLRERATMATEVLGAAREHLGLEKDEDVDIALVIDQIIVNMVHVEGTDWPQKVVQGAVQSLSQGEPA